MKYEKFKGCSILCVKKSSAHRCTEASYTPLPALPGRRWSCFRRGSPHRSRFGSARDTIEKNREHSGQPEATCSSWTSGHTWSEQSKSSHSCLCRSMPSEHLKDTGCTFVGATGVLRQCLDESNEPRTSGEHGTSCSQRFGWRRGRGHSCGAEDRLSRQTGRRVIDGDDHRP